MAYFVSDTKREAFVDADNFFSGLSVHIFSQGGFFGFVFVSHGRMHSFALRGAFGFCLLAIGMEKEE